MAYQGRCKPCKTLYRWSWGSPPLRKTACPECGRPLTRTTHLTKDPLRRLNGAPWSKRPPLGKEAS